MVQAKAGFIIFAVDTKFELHSNVCRVFLVFILYSVNRVACSSISAIGSIIIQGIFNRCTKKWTPFTVNIPSSTSRTIHSDAPYKYTIFITIFEIFSTLNSFEDSAIIATKRKQLIVHWS